MFIAEQICLHVLGVEERKKLGFDLQERSWLNFCKTGQECHNKENTDLHLESGRVTLSSRYGVMVRSPWSAQSCAKKEACRYRIEQNNRDAEPGLGTRSTNTFRVKLRIVDVNYLLSIQSVSVVHAGT